MTPTHNMLQLLPYSGHACARYMLSGPYSLWCSHRAKCSCSCSSCAVPTHARARRLASSQRGPSIFTPNQATPTLGRSGL